MRIIASVQVRLGSTRLPRKALKEIMDKPVLYYLIERLKRATLVDDIIVATSVEKIDDDIEMFCRNNAIHCFRGSEQDVLGRVLGALKYMDADVGVEVYGDCPLIDPEVVDEIVGFYLDNRVRYDFVTNGLKSTYPPGLEVEVYPVSILEDSSKQINDLAIREHGTLFIRKNPQKYRLYNIEAPNELYYPDYYIELDTQEDFIIIKNIYEELYPENPDFRTIDVIDYLTKNKNLRELNSNVHRRWKEFRVEYNQ